MKKTFIGGLIMVSFIFTMCEKDDKNTTGGPAPTPTGNDTTVTDIDGNVYNTKTIGSQIWMTENLKVTKYRDGSTIQHAPDSATWVSTIGGAYCAYNNNSANVSTYGRLYNGYAVRDSRNVAPQGWRVPTYADWLTLANNLGGFDNAGFELKESGTSHWQNPNYASNSSGFTALPAGMRPPYGINTFYGIGHYTDFWSTSECCGAGSFLYYYSLFSSDSSLGHTYGLENTAGFSIRCIKE